MERVSQKEMVARALIATLHKPRIKTNRIPQLEANMKRCFSVIIEACMYQLTLENKQELKHAKLNTKCSLHCSFQEKYIR